MNGYGYLIVGIVVVAIIALLATNKKFVETLKNIYKIEELRKRILYTLGLLLVYRLGCFVVIPGINPNALGEGSALANQMSDNSLQSVGGQRSSGPVERILRRCIRQCGDFCTRSDAVHHRFDHHSVDGHHDSLLPEDAERG